MSKIQSQLPKENRPCREKTKDEFNEDLGVAIIETTERHAKDYEEFAKRVQAAKDVLDHAASNFRAATMEFVKVEIPNALKEIREARMAIGAECFTLTKQLEDLRKFFLGPDHDREIERLREFVGLCERLKALKDSGFLDAVADTMIKLA